jgi:hypothetical protein
VRNKDIDVEILRTMNRELAIGKLCNRPLIYKYGFLSVRHTSSTTHVREMENIFNKNRR